MQLFCPVLTLGKCSCLCRILIHGLHRFHPGLNFLVNAWTKLAMAAATCTSTHATTGKLGQNPCASSAIRAAQVTLAPDIPMQLYMDLCACVPCFPFLPSCLLFFCLYFICSENHARSAQLQTSEIKTLEPKGYSQLHLLCGFAPLNASEVKVLHATKRVCSLLLKWHIIADARWIARSRTIKGLT